jgi:hypothetical protein
VPCNRARTLDTDNRRSVAAAIVVSENGPYVAPSGHAPLMPAIVINLNVTLGMRHLRWADWMKAAPSRHCRENVRQGSTVAKTQTTLRAGVSMMDR